MIKKMNTNPIHLRKTVEIREVAKEKGVEAWETLERKELLLAIKAIDKLKTPVDTPDKEEDKNELKEEIKEDKPTQKVQNDGLIVENAESIETAGVTTERVGFGGKAYEMKKKLAAQPKKPFYIPLENGEKFGATKSVTLNGFRTNIMKGMFVDLPQQLAEVLQQNMQISQQVLEGHKNRIDGNEAELIR